MNHSQKNIRDELYQIFIKYKKRYKNPPKSKQLCCMWSINNPPDLIEGTAPFIEIEDTFNIEISGILHLPVYTFWSKLLIFWESFPKKCKVLWG